MTHTSAKLASGIAAIALVFGVAKAAKFDDYICTTATQDPTKIVTDYGTLIDAGIMGDDVGYMIDTNGDGHVDVFIIDRGGDGDTFEEIARYPAGKTAVRVLSMRDSRCK